MADVVYNKFKNALATGGIDLDTDTFNIMLVTATYVPDKDLHNFRSDVTNEVANGNGYTTGGKALTGVTVTRDDTNDLTKFDATDPSWAASTITARGAVIYKARGGAATADELVCYLDFGSNISSTNGTFSVTFNAGGILTLA